MPIAVVVFDFDPYVQLFGDLSVRLGAIALAIVIALALVVAGVLARGARLRADDVVFIAVGIVPGAVVGGRLGYLIVHWSFYASDPGSLLDPAIGGMELGLAVVGGFLTGSYVASLLGGPLRRWWHLAALPVLFGLGAGKMTMVLTGSGQGTPSTAAWATAYLGAGPWGSLGPAIPSNPSQAYEGIATLAILMVLLVALSLGAFGRRDGRLLFVAIGLWALARVAVSTTWRDPTVTAGLGAGGILALGIAVGCAIAIVVLSLRQPEPDPVPPGGPDGTTVRPLGSGPAPDEVAWPDPASRPRF